MSAETTNDIVEYLRQDVYQASRGGLYPGCKAVSDAILAAATAIERLRKELDNCTGGEL